MIPHIPIEPAEHEVIQVRFSDHGHPADMCAFCSIPSRGQWIPANACPAACAWRMTRDAPRPRRVIDARPAPAPRAYEAAVKARELLEQWDCGCPGEHHQYCSRYVPPPIHIPEEIIIVNRRKCGCHSCKRSAA